jgi:hypothetical protein
MAGDRTDRPTSHEQGFGFQLFLPCEHLATGPFDGLLPGSRSIEGTPPALAGDTPTSRLMGGEFQGSS